MKNIFFIWNNLGWESGLKLNLLKIFVAFPNTRENEV